ncbi:sensor histidine kinase [Paenibacillus tarimensis]|uniref:sensor histidine kinase n=1 Tax=Paenibacillus tarimensis TaxID=416012 RepID=UPI001F424F8E|nr:ATP-binding protein [Paenibacillus tarimensis]MCF2945240.1 HAMP domain-containing histidine kinase [Paenibacillus tarimensis]
MRNKDWLYTIRWRMLLVFLGSLSITAVAVYTGYTLSELILSMKGLNKPLAWIINSIGSLPVMIAGGIVLFLVSFFLLSRRLVQDLRKIEQGLKELSNGRFGYQVPVKSYDELGAVADSVNRMSGRLDRYLQGITQGLQEIANGNFDYEIPVRDGSKLGEVADSINKMSRQLHRSIEEERNAERTKNDLITGVSHDLRTPLTSILGFLEVIEEDRYQDEVELRYFISIAYEKSLALKKLIDDLFEYTRITNGLPLELGELDMAGFLRQLAEEFVPSLEKAGMVCRVNILEGYESVKILADGDLLVRAYENLMTNAIRYGQAGGAVDIGLYHDSGELVVTVTNYGEPIPEKDLPFIFDRFYRVERSRSKETGGTGLGLAITKSIIEVHGGRIMVRSSRKATTFETRFAAVEGAVMAKEEIA